MTVLNVFHNNNIMGGGIAAISYIDAFVPDSIIHIHIRHLQTFHNADDFAPKQPDDYK